MQRTDIKIIASFFLIGIAFLSFALFVDRSSDTVLNESNNSEVMLAASGESYVSISGVDFDEEGLSDEGIIGILGLVFVWGIRIAIALALVFVVVGAVQYMTTDAIYDKKEGKKRIQAAIGGLILALVSWLILNTINPDIMGSNFLNRLNELDGSDGSARPANQDSGVEVINNDNDGGGTADDNPRGGTDSSDDTPED